ncbi:MAG TPA: class I SAM-dependent methyltransferase [Gemmatimonadaceae bacterium]|nr:class I SAM-dependent methyltransferase [Gemmatimonadaceae bacterium]
MAQQNPRSLKHEYELYVENEIENYKESVSRSAILKIGDEAAASLRAGEQFAMDELLLWAEVDRIIIKRLRIPTYGTWRRKRLKLLEEYRRPEHWGIRPDGVLAREIHPPAESKVLVAGGDIDRTALYLAAHGCDVTAVDREVKPLERVMNAAQEAGLADRIQSYVAGITDWSPDVQLGAVVCTPEAFSGLSAEERDRAFELLRDATRDGGVHLVGTIVRGQRGLSVTELRRQYKGWSISIEEDSGSSKSFLARKIAS